MLMGEKIREYRKRRGISMTFIAGKVGISSSRMYHLEKGMIRLKVEEYERICKDGFGVDPAFFYTDAYLLEKNKTQE